MVISSPRKPASPWMLTFEAFPDHGIMWNVWISDFGCGHSLPRAPLIVEYLTANTQCAHVREWRGVLDSLNAKNSRHAPATKFVDLRQVALGAGMPAALAFEEFLQHGIMANSDAMSAWFKGSNCSRTADC